jgi:hypothetical protein
VTQVFSVRTRVLSLSRVLQGVRVRLHQKLQLCVQWDDSVSKGLKTALSVRPDGTATRLMCQ